MLVCSDDYLLELEREDFQARWLAANSDGEVVGVEADPVRLLNEVLSPSLFAPKRLLVVRDTNGLLGSSRGEASDGPASGRPSRGPGRSREEELAAGLGQAPRHGVTVLFTLQSGTVPKGPFGDLVQEQGEIRSLPLPPPPKPWEQVTVTPAQRRVLAGLIRRVAPSLADLDDTVDALCECYGFRPRELVQAAQRLCLAGALTPEAVRVQAGAGEVAFSELEDALISRSASAAARFVAVLGSGGSLRLFGDRLVDRGGVGPVVAGGVARLLRQALAVRRHARQGGMAGELDPARCSRQRWYGERFKNGLYPRLQEEAGKVPASPLSAVKSPWVAHRLFRIAAAYDDRELLRALSRLGSVVPEREDSPAAAMAALAPALMELIHRSSRPEARRGRGG